MLSSVSSVQCRGKETPQGVSSPHGYNLSLILILTEGSGCPATIPECCCLHRTISVFTPLVCDLSPPCGSSGGLLHGVSEFMALI